MKASLGVSIFAVLAVTARAERINHEGRILGPEIAVTEPILFNTSNADAVLSAMQIMPPDSAWNEDVSRRPLLANSSAMIAQIRSDLASSRRTLRAFHEMNFVLVPDTQPEVSVDFVDYPDESDPSPYPIPGDMPVETWPRETGLLTLEQWQRDVNGDGGDRHAIVVMPGTGFIWEMWQARLVGSAWQASNGAKFPLRNNDPRPDGWTSGDAAGLPMFPALVRYDECLRGMVEHAMRIVVRRTRRAYVYPATHYASSTPATETNVPAMGQRLRLRSDFEIPDTWTVFEKAVCLGLKKYGALVADNGNFFSISVTPDDRYPEGAFDHLANIDVDNFEVVESTGPEEGPRSPGAPAASAGADFGVTQNTPILLTGSATGSGLTYGWTVASGPDGVSFANADQAVTNVTFSTDGIYTLILSASDGVHSTAYDAVVITVSRPPPPSASDEPRLQNLSTRSLVATGDAVQIGGFTIAGETPRRVLIRAAGPALANFGVTGALADPVLAVYSGSTLIEQNDDWDEALATEFARVGAAAWMSGSKDAALLLTLPPGGYTGTVFGKGGTSGVALFEVYDDDESGSTSHLSNISTRSLVGVDDAVQIGGFVVSGAPKRVLIRAAGPSLADLGVSGVLEDPVLKVYSGQSVIAQNDDWSSELTSDFEAVGAFAFPTPSKDAAIVLLLEPGAYTAQVSGKGSTGVALVEVYEED